MHQPVLLSESIQALNIREDGCYLDATFGRGGHASVILENLGPDGKLIVMDRDEQAIACANERYSEDDRVVIHHDWFGSLSNYISEGTLDGALFDLGVSSPQLDQDERGFSFQRKGPLDMRMDTSRGLSAAEWIAVASEKEMTKVFFDYGEEPRSRAVARELVKVRSEEAITDTARLAEVVARAAAFRKAGKHPATRVFQAIRIFINDEINEALKAMESVLECLAPNGRLAIISFHSLEDRQVKRFIRRNDKGPEIPRGLPVMGQSFGPLKSVGKAVKPSADEVRENPRSRSSILRIAEKRA